jgi:hypothetical protein
MARIPHLREKLGSLSEYVREIKVCFTRFYNKRHSVKSYNFTAQTNKMSGVCVLDSGMTSFCIPRTIRDTKTQFAFLIIHIKKSGLSFRKLRAEKRIKNLSPYNIKEEGLALAGILNIKI